MPLGAGDAKAFLNAAEDRDRKNARVIDKVMIALPRELTAAQRKALVRSFAEAITQGKASWFAAFHEKGKDEKNPHCHLVIRDRDPATGKRVAKLSEKQSTLLLRELWESHANQALAEARQHARIDRRSLKAQGIDRQPTIHEGVRARQLVQRRMRPLSRSRSVANHCQARLKSRMVEYQKIDKGASRLGYNLSIRRGNLRDARQNQREAEYWKQIDADALKRDLLLFRRLHSSEERDLYISQKSRDEMSIDIN